MEESEIFEVLSSFKNAIDILTQRLDSLEEEYPHIVEQTNERLANLEKTFFDDILEPAKAAAQESEENAAIEDMRSRYAEDFDRYNGRLRSIEGDDFDIAREAYKGFNEFNNMTEDKMDEADYVAALFEKVDGQLNAIRDAIGAEEVTAEVDEDGNTKIAVDGQEVDLEEETKNSESGSEEEIRVSDDELTEEETKALEAEMRKEGLIK